MGSGARLRKGRARSPGVQNGPPKTIAIDIVATDRCFASSVALTTDVLVTANTIAGALGRTTDVFRWRVVSLDGEPVKTSAGGVLPVDGVARSTADVIVVCGPGMADVRHVLGDVRASSSLVGILRRARTDTILAASCSSTFLLAEAGVLDGLRATTSWWLAPTFRATYPKVSLLEGEMLVDAGRVVTAGAALAHTELVVHLVRRLAGASLAEACAKYLVVDDRRRGQSPFVIVEHMARVDPAIEQAEAAIRKNPVRPPSLAELARGAGMTPRTLSRRFVAATGFSPQRFVRRVRLELAAQLLRSTSDPVEVIAGRVGYDDDRAFRRAFQRELGESPARHRARG